MLSRAIAVLAALQLSDMSLRTHVQGFLSHSLPLQVALRRASSEARSVSTRCVKAGCSTMLVLFDAICVRLWCWWSRSEDLHTLVRSPSGSVHTAPNTGVRIWLISLRSSSSPPCFCSVWCLVVVRQTQPLSFVRNNHSNQLCHCTLDSAINENASRPSGLRELPLGELAH